MLDSEFAKDVDVNVSVFEQDDATINILNGAHIDTLLGGRYKEPFRVHQQTTATHTFPYKQSHRGK